MHIIALLKAYKTHYPNEQATVERFITFAKEGENWFSRTRLDGHFTGSAWLVSGCGKRVLLTHHKKLNRWLQLGGHADGNPILKEVALQEAYEESGLKNLKIEEALFDIDVHAIPERGAEPAHLHWDVRFVVKNLGSDAFNVSDESHALAWVDIADMINNPQYGESLQRMARKWLARVV